MANVNCGLSEFFGDLTARVPDGPPQNACFIFHEGVLPSPPPSISTDRILIRKVNHDYHCFRADGLWMYLSPQKCRELGVFLLAAGFHGPQQPVTLLLNHPDSDIRRLIIRETDLRLDDPPVGFSTAPFSLRYYPDETRKHPWLYQCEVFDLPRFELSNADDSVGVSEEDWSNRDTVWMGPAPGTFLFAELLLNAGCSWNSVREYELEGDAGYRGVGRMSAELSIFLPGSDGWIYPGDDVPTPQPE